MLIISGHDCQKHPNHMRNAFRLRHNVFVDEKGWEDLRAPDRYERDAFDHAHAVHMLLYEQDQLVGYQRMLPTMRPNLLHDVYPELCETALPADPTIWEWTRYAVPKHLRGGRQKLGYHGATMLCGLVEWAMAKGVQRIVIEMNPLWMLTLMQLQFRIETLGRLKILQGEKVIAVLASFDQHTLDTLREVRGSNEPIFQGTKLAAIQRGTYDQEKIAAR